MENSLDEVIGKQLQALISTEPDKVKILTDIASDREALTFATLLTIAKRYNLKWLEDLTIETLLLRISKKRSREKAIIEVAKGLWHRATEESQTLREKIRALFR